MPEDTYLDEQGRSLIQPIPPSFLETLTKHNDWVTCIPYGAPIFSHLKIYPSGRSSIQINGGCAVVFSPRLTPKEFSVTLYPAPHTIVSLYAEDEGLPTMMANLMCVTPIDVAKNQDESNEDNEPNLSL